MYLRKTVFLIVGVSKSGVGIAELLLKRGAKCYVYDDNENDRIKANLAELAEHGASVARKLGKRITGELELASEFCLAPIIAVTGTNGKTTTCTMIDAVLHGAGIKSELCGNVGTPLSAVEDNIDPDTVVVLEKR